ncbi:GntR family transcriptional regulator [Salibaculum sp.]|uniref:GntR family transcriptional regulator n=1 Tax=Salibaculum sp. TaxID=2855480 RepID=UPI002B467237|nr:GntR family transcriptional regulator [Salibaculum sp.]HKL68295.1 GntR family transcriptional regulator [Salibaculum sp.]
MQFDARKNTEGTRAARPVRALVSDALRAGIASGNLAPGMRLSERKLCAELGVSRAIMREAVRQLESEELVSISPQSGTFVASPTLSDALDIYEVRVELEGLAGRLAARLCDEAALTALDEALDEIAHANARGTVAQIVAAKTRFYECLVEAASNKVLRNSLQRLRNRILLYRGIALNEPTRAAAALSELREIRAAIAAGDAARAEQMNRAHIAEAARSLTRVLCKKAGRSLTPVERARLDLLGAGDENRETRAALDKQGAEK